MELNLAADEECECPAEYEPVAALDATHSRAKALADTLGGLSPNRVVRERLDQIDWLIQAAAAELARL